MHPSTQPKTSTNETTLSSDDYEVAFTDLQKHLHESNQPFKTSACTHPWDMDNNLLHCLLLCIISASEIEDSR